MKQCPQCGFCITEAWGKEPEGNRCPLCYAANGLTVEMEPSSFADLRQDNDGLGDARASAPT